MHVACSVHCQIGMLHEKKGRHTGSRDSVKSGSVLCDEDLNRRDKGSCVGAKVGEEECLWA